MTGTIEKAHGRWREILGAFGISPEILSGKAQPCPMCGGTDRFTWDNKTGDGNYICRHCGAGKGVQFLMALYGWGYKRAFDEVDAIIGNLPPPQLGPEFYRAESGNPASLRRLYNASDAVRAGDHVDLYLTERGLGGMRPKALRTIHDLKHRATDTLHPGMLAVFCDASGKPATIHRTFLTSHGSKADVDPCRMLMPGKMPEGGAVRLAAAAETMGIAEGIENALSASRLFNIPVWAATNRVLLEKWHPPGTAKHIMIFGDNDRNFDGQASAYRLASNLMKPTPAQWLVEVMIPPGIGNDWNDILKLQKGDGDASVEARSDIRDRQFATSDDGGGQTDSDAGPNGIRKDAASG